MTKTKTYGLANNVGVPADEMALACAVQSAQARGLSVVWGPKYRYEGGVLVGACAYGALVLDRGAWRVMVNYGLVIMGHESHDLRHGLYGDIADHTGFMTGVAFADAMGAGCRPVRISPRRSALTTVA